MTMRARTQLLDTGRAGRDWVPFSMADRRPEASLKSSFVLVDLGSFIVKVKGGGNASRSVLQQLVD